MGRADDLIHAEQRIVLGRLAREDVEGRAGDMADFDAPPSDPASTTRPPRAQLMILTPLLVLRERLGVDDVAGAVGQRRVQGDEIGAGQQLVQLDLLDAEVDGPLLRQIGIEGDHPHLQPMRAVGDDRADIAAADRCRASCRSARRP